jgi:hypothetical protein
MDAKYNSNSVCSILNLSIYSSIRHDNDRIMRIDMAERGMFWIF